MRWRFGVVALVPACVFAAGALADVPLSGGQTITTVGGTVTIGAGIVDSGPYTLSIADTHPSVATICAAKLAGPKRAVKGNIKLTGRVPTSLGCYSSDGSLLTRVKLKPGTYTLFLCQADGPTGCNGDKTVIKHPVVVRAQTKQKSTG
jgi:hypothetical protein